MSKVVLVDDHELIREGLKKVLIKHADIEVAAEFEDAEGLFNFLKEGEADIVILDITLPGRSGLDIIKDIKMLRPGIKVLVLSMHPEERFAMRALKAGASGYLSKQSAASDLLRGIRKVMGGGRFISETLAEQILFKTERGIDKALHESLSGREFEILRMISMGKSVGDIAAELSLSVNTVTSYRTRLLEKMNMKSNAEIVRYAVENQLIE